MPFARVCLQELLPQFREGGVAQIQSVQRRKSATAEVEELRAARTFCSVNNNNTMHVSDFM